MIAEVSRFFERLLRSGLPQPLPRTFREEVLSSHSYLPASLAMHFAGMCLVTLLFWHWAPSSTLVTWVLVFLVIWIARFVHRVRAGSLLYASEDELLRWRLLSNFGGLGIASLWGLASWMLYPLGGFAQQTGLIVLIYTFSVVAVPPLATQPRMYLAFVGLCFMPLIARIALADDPRTYELAGVLLLILSITVLLARNHREATERVLDLKVRADDLLQQLRAEKLAAEDARRAAELANRVKTQFFIAASHDLRQPLHAMGLFVEALRQKIQGGDLVRLVDCIDSSVDALNDLFSELLDISRLDAGVVTVSQHGFEMGDIFRKLRLNFDPIALEKGLMLRVRGDRQVVHADPILVERILRNLVSNAIRYAESGTVLVSARRKGGQVLLQVWDTGTGISEANQQRVFEEFFQVPREESQQIEQTKGLGLGLSIVQRLSTLMNAPLAMHSQLGRGTVFSLTLPVGERLEGSVSVATPLRLADPTLHDRVVVIVEDDVSIRSGLDLLLRGWGAQVVSFDGYSSAASWLNQQRPGHSRVPDVMIVDYGLGAGANGVQVIEAVRRTFAAHVPAIVVTGSSHGLQESLARQHDFHVLAKPVAPSRLRAMISFKLGGRKPPEAAALVGRSELQVVDQSGRPEPRRA